MKKTITRALTLIGVLLGLYFLAAMLATFTQLADAADRLHAGAGQAVFWALLALFTALVTTPLVLVLRLPKAMQAPDDTSEPAYSHYRHWLQQHLAQCDNPQVQALARQDDVPGALALLGHEADRLIRQTASSVFISTALIQNGRLDGLIMLAAQLRLVWQVAALYQLRPSPRQLWYLYSNVGATLLLATQLEELNFAELAAPIVNSAAPSLAGALPGLQGIGNLLANSMANGSANAFLTLRVGLIAKAYCTPLVEPDAKAVQKSATLAALVLLGEITKQNGALVAKGVWSGVTGVFGKAAASSVDVASGALQSTSRIFKRKTQPAQANGDKSAPGTTELTNFSLESPHRPPHRPP